ADMSMLRAVREHPPAMEDENVRTILLHILQVQRMFLAVCSKQPYDYHQESQVPSSFDELEQRFRETHPQEIALVDNLDGEALSKLVEFAPRPQWRITTGEALLQAVMHSQHHRGQVASRLRALGGNPPIVDFIIWAQNRPVTV